MENKILDILNKYESSSNRVIYEGNFKNIANEIFIEVKLLNAELQAKVYTYEKIIANSNFKPILEDKKLKENIEEVEGQQNEI